MTFILIDSTHLKTALEEFCALLTSLVGPDGNLCVIKSSVGSLTLTSTSSRILTNLSFKSPIFQFALQSIRAQTERYGDSGLYCGILISKLLIPFYDCSSSSQHTAASILTNFGSIVHTELQNSPILKLEVNLNSVQPLLAVARSVLFSKYGIFEGKNKAALDRANSQASLLVRAFLQSEASVGKVLLNVHEDCENQHLSNGILYPCSDNEHIVLCKTPWYSVDIMLFSVMLTDKVEPNEQEQPGVDLFQKGQAQLRASQMFIDTAVSKGIQVIACQKVIHPMLLLNLRRQGILVLQRLGRQKAEALENLSGAIPISSLKASSLENLSKFKGNLKSVKHVVESGNDFVLLEGAFDSGICSLLLTSKTKESAAELKVVAQQVLGALCQMLQDSAVYPGAGCTEMYLCCFLSHKIQEEKEDLCRKHGCSSYLVESALRWLQEGLLLASGLNWRGGKLAVDSIYHHAWKGSDSKSTIMEAEKCNCGLVMANSVCEYQGSWTLVHPEYGESFPRSLNYPPQPPNLKGSQSSLDAVFDGYSCKRNAFKLALDTCVALTNIGAMIVKTDA